MPRLTRVITAAMAAAVALTVTATVPAGAAQRHAAKTSPEYYLALGDSLAVGVQPNAKGVDMPTPQGYADQLYAAIKPKDSDLRMVKLGCPGETSKTLNKGGICGYKGAHRFSLTGRTGSQLAAALAFLHFHPGGVPLITIDIGANDLNHCIEKANGSIKAIVECLTPVFPAISKNLAVTLAALRKADPHAAIVGMTYYDPELVAWLLRTTAGQQFATGSVAVAGVFRQLLVSDYEAFKDPVAGVFRAFDTTDMKDMVTVPGIGPLPKDVALICEWTYECTPKPVGPNEHANKAGYHVITQAFLATLSHLKHPF